jgi:hypothetical protein
MHGMRKHRFVHATLLVVALLFSQWAVAMHACAVAVPAVSAHATGAHDPCCPDPVAPNTCEQHCAYGAAAVDPAKPAATLDVTLGPALVLRTLEPARALVRIDRPRVAATDPPPSVRFSVLRI